MRGDIKYGFKAYLLMCTLIQQNKACFGMNRIIHCRFLYAAVRNAMAAIRKFAVRENSNHSFCGCFIDDVAAKLAVAETNSFACSVHNDVAVEDQILDTSLFIREYEVQIRIRY